VKQTTKLEMLLPKSADLLMGAFWGALLNLRLTLTILRSKTDKEEGELRTAGKKGKVT